MHCPPEEVIRPAAGRDADAIARMHARSWRATYRGLLSDAFLDCDVDEERHQVWRDRFDTLTPDAFGAFLAEDASGPIGFAAVLLDAPSATALLDNLHVVPERQRLGVGRRLMAEAARWTLRAAPGAPLYLWVLEANSGARRFYQALGGTECGIEPQRMPDGSTLLAVRCQWDDPRRLLASGARENGGV
jgi:GNAT superfamily N-acetyltransferase